jgi:hypothetical protein
MREMTVAKQTYQPDWRWSKHMKPFAGSDSCQMRHFGVCISGRMRVKTIDGNEMEFGPGDVSDIPPGHDDWVVGDEPAIFYAFNSGSGMK